MNFDAEEREGADEVNNVDNVGNLADRAFLIPFGDLPGTSDARMRYFVDQTKYGEEYYGASALNTTTFRDFKKQVSQLLYNALSDV
jgi:hypothetical protein